MPILKIKFDNGYEFNIDRILKRRGEVQGSVYIQGSIADTVSITAPLLKPKELEEWITPENMKHFIVYRDEEEIAEYSGYSDIYSITETIDKTQQTFTVESRFKGQ